MNPPTSQYEESKLVIFTYDPKIDDQNIYIEANDDESSEQKCLRQDHMFKMFRPEKEIY